MTPQLASLTTDLLLHSSLYQSLYPLSLSLSLSMSLSMSVEFVGLPVESCKNDHFTVFLSKHVEIPFHARDAAINICG